MPRYAVPQVDLSQRSDSEKEFIADELNLIRHDGGVTQPELQRPHASSSMSSGRGVAPCGPAAVGGNAWRDDNANSTSSDADVND